MAKKSSAQTKAAARLITGARLSRDILSQKFYRAIAEEQAAVHERQVCLCRDILRIMDRLNAGAIEEDGELCFDAERQMVLPREYVESGGRG